MNKKGFTLIEVLISTAIMVSVLGSLLFGLTQCSSLMETMSNRDIALHGAEEKLEEILESDLNQITDYNGQTFDIEDIQGNTLLTTAPGETGMGQVSVTQVGTTELYDIVVTVTWQQKGGRVISRALYTTVAQR